MRGGAARALLLAAAAAAAAVAGEARAEGPPVRRDPYVGYVFPAGGRLGTSFEVTAGGQNLQTVTGVHVSGEGVQATLVRYEGAARRLNGDERRELRRRLEELRGRRRAEAAGKAPPPPTATPVPPSAGGRPGAKPEAKEERVELPNHPLLRILDQLSLKELDRVEARFLVDDDRRQPNAQIAELVLLRVAVDPAASPGDREIRLLTRLGLTNPLRFQVGALPEYTEEEPVGFRPPPPVPVLTPPVLLNGQVLPGDVDRYRIRAKRGQRLVIETRARRLIPYLADAVPGWFQATAALKDEKGVEVAFADDYRFDPDPVLFCEVPRDGEYGLEIADALFRGREDFVYRVSVGEEPFITGMFPLGGREGVAAAAALVGWNLPLGLLPLDTRPGGRPVRFATAGMGEGPSNRVPYEVDPLPEGAELEPNGAATGGEPLALPRIVNGRIGEPGDVDVFRFEGRAGQEVVAEVRARRLGSPLDSLLRLLDDAGGVVAWNDDHEDREAGLLTHHADSWLLARLPADGTYRVQVSDTQGHGGDEYAYRLRVGPPRPDFTVVTTPSSLNVPAGGMVPFAAHAVRKDGFAGDVAIRLVGAPEGFALSGARIPAGRDMVRATLSAPLRGTTAGPFALRMEARARIGDRTVVRPVVPSQDMMQAFAYRHLAASQDLLVAVLPGGRPWPALDRMGTGPVRLSPGGSALVRFASPIRAMPEGIRLELSEPPPGVVLEEVAVTSGVLALILRAEASAKPGPQDNLVVEVFADGSAGRRGGGSAEVVRSIPVGYLPAIPLEIVPR